MTRYRALTGLSYPTDKAIIRRIQEGESIPTDERGAREVTPGEIVDDIPSVSVPWLLEQGQIELASLTKSSTARYEWVSDSEVYHDRALTIEECNIDDTAEPTLMANVPPAGRTLCHHCETSYRNRLDDPIQ